MNDQETLAYLGGFVDGEGSIAIGINNNQNQRGGSRRWYLRFSVHQLDPRPLAVLARVFGGTTRYHRYAKDRPDKRGIYEWVVVSEKAYAAIRTLRPYLLVKSEQADVAMQFQETLQLRGLPRTTPLSTEEQETRNQFYLKLRELKQQTYE